MFFGNIQYRVKPTGFTQLDPSLPRTTIFLEQQHWTKATTTPQPEYIVIEEDQDMHRTGRAQQQFMAHRQAKIFGGIQTTDTPATATTTTTIAAQQQQPAAEQMEKEFEMDVPSLLRCPDCEDFVPWNLIVVFFYRMEVFVTLQGAENKIVHMPKAYFNCQPCMNRRKALFPICWGTESSSSLVILPPAELLITYQQKVAQGERSYTFSEASAEKALAKLCLSDQQL